MRSSTKKDTRGVDKDDTMKALLALCANEDEGTDNKADSSDSNISD